MSLDRTQLEAEVVANYPDNASGEITPAILRTTTNDIINNSVLPEDILAGTGINIDKSALPAITINSTSVPYTGATQDLNLGTHGLEASTLQVGQTLYNLPIGLVDHTVGTLHVYGEWIYTNSSNAIYSLWVQSWEYFISSDGTNYWITNNQDDPIHATARAIGPLVSSGSVCGVYHALIGSGFTGFATIQIVPSFSFDTIGDAIIFNLTVGALYNGQVNLTPDWVKLRQLGINGGYICCEMQSANGNQVIMCDEFNAINVISGTTLLDHGQIATDGNGNLYIQAGLAVGYNPTTLDNGQVYTDGYGNLTALTLTAENGWTGTFATGDSHTATVVNGIITNVA